MTPAEVNALLAAQAAQDQQNQQQSQPGNVLNTLAAIGAGAAAVLGGQRLLRGRSLGSTVDLSGVNLQNIRRKAADLVAPAPSTPPPARTSAERLQQIDDVTRAARAERMPGVIQAKLPSASEVAAAEKLLGDKELLKYVEAEEMAAANILPETRAEQSRQQAQVRRAQSALADQALAEIRAEQTEAVAKTANTVQAAAQDTLQDYLTGQGYKAKETLVDQQISNAPLRSDQAAAATLSAEDQQTGRVMRGIQRNEDLDLGAINAAKEQTEAQLESLVDVNPNLASSIELDAAINEVASSLPDGLPVDQAEGVTRSITAQEQLNLAKEQMIARRQELEARGLKPGTVRFERALAEPFRTSATTQMRGTGAVETALPAGPIRETVESVSASEYLPERSVLNVGPQAVVTSTAAGTSIRGAAPSYFNVPAKEDTRQLFGTPEPLVPGAPAEMAQDLPGSARVRGVIPDVDPSQLSKQEIVYGALDRPASPEPAGGSAGIGVYGIEPGYVPGAMSKATGEYSEASARKPTYVPGWLQKREAKTGFESLSTEQLSQGAEQAKVGAIKSAFESELGRRQRAKESMAVSEAMRRARIEGRDPQSVLRSLGFGV